MNNFNDRVYLILTLSGRELFGYYLKTIMVIVAVSVYNLIGVFLHTPILVEYYALLGAFILVSLVFFFLKIKALPIDWELLAEVEERLKRKAEEPTKVEEPKEVEEVVEEVLLEPSNEEIQMVEEVEVEFDFGDKLTSLYKTGAPKDLSNAAVTGVEQKIRRMNIH